MGADIARDAFEAAAGLFDGRGDGGGDKRSGAVARDGGGDAVERARVAFHHVVAAGAVDVHVDESRHDGHCRRRRNRPRRPARGFHRDGRRGDAAASTTITPSLISSWASGCGWRGWRWSWHRSPALESQGLTRECYSEAGRRNHRRALHPVASSLQSMCRSNSEGERDGIRQALRGAEAAAPAPQDSQGQSETLRTGKTSARQASRAGQEISDAARCAP